MTTNQRTLVLGLVATIALASARTPDARAADRSCPVKVVLLVGSITEAGLAVHRWRKECDPNNLQGACWTARWSVAQSAFTLVLATLSTYCSCVPAPNAALCAFVGVTVPEPDGGNVGPGPGLILPNRKLWLPPQ